MDKKIGDPLEIRTGKDLLTAIDFFHNRQSCYWICDRFQRARHAASDLFIFLSGSHATVPLSPANVDVNAGSGKVQTYREGARIFPGDGIGAISHADGGPGQSGPLILQVEQQLPWQPWFDHGSGARDRALQRPA